MMKNKITIALSILSLSSFVFADTQLTGRLGDSKGDATLTMRTQIVFAGVSDPQGRRVLLGVELIEESDTAAILECRLEVTRSDNTSYQTQVAVVELKWGVTTECKFPTNEGDVLLINLTATPAFLATLLGGEAQAAS